MLHLDGSVLRQLMAHTAHVSKGLLRVLPGVSDSWIHVLDALIFGTCSSTRCNSHETGSLIVKDETGKSCGTLKVSVRWRKPLKLGGRQLGPNALTATETDDIMARFSPQKDGQVSDPLSLLLGIYLLTCHSDRVSRVWLDPHLK